MLLSLDYDQTYTRDPDFWDGVIAAGIARGHSFVCITNRPNPPGTGKAERLPSPRIPVLCAGQEFKQDAARAAGLKVSVWIDDMPASINQPFPQIG
jgi:hypothetical protein